MGLLGNSFDDPRTSAVMALSGGLLSGNFGAGLVGANAAFREAQDSAVKRKYVDMQMQNMQSEIEQRKTAMERQQQLMQMAQRLTTGGGSAPAAPGQLGSGSFGVVPPPAGMSDMPTPRPAGLAGANFNDVVSLHAAGGPDLLNAYKLAREGFERKPGSFYEGINGGREYIPDPAKGFSYQNGQVGLLPGYTNALAQTTLATEAPKTLLNSASQVSLRDNADGTKSPVSSFAENPTLQNILGAIFTNQGQSPMPAQPRPQMAPQPMAPQPRPMPQAATATAAQPSVNGAFVGSPELVSQSIEDIKDPQERANARAAFESQMRASGGQLPRYGKTTTQETSDASNKTYQEQVAKDTAAKRQQIVESGSAAPNKIAKLNYLNKLLADVDGGKLTPTGTHVASALNSVGIKVDPNLPNKEAASALANEMALELRNPNGGAGMPGALSDSDRDFLSSMTPNMGQSLRGRQSLVQAKIALAQREQQVATFARNYENKYGKLDNKFFEQLQAWSNSNPLFGSK